MNEIEGRFSDINALSYKAKRIVSLKNRPPHEEHWHFRFKKPDHVRIDFQVLNDTALDSHVPRERSVILDGETALEFIPEIRKAVKTDLTVMTQEQRTKFREGILSFVSVDGLRANQFQKTGKKPAVLGNVRWHDADAYKIEGGDPRYVLYIDKEKKVILRMETYDTSGSLVLRADASRFTEVIKGFWMPQEIHTTYHASEGYIQSVVLLQDIRANITIPDDQFRLNAPPGVEILSVPNAPDKTTIPSPEVPQK